MTRRQDEQGIDIKLLYKAPMRFGKGGNRLDRLDYALLIARSIAEPLDKLPNF